MSQYSKYNFVYRLQKWMDTVQGQTFLNYAYSWGASVVILGALFKLTHLPGANLALFIGMGTEVFVFFISAFDRPFDKTADGREIPTKVTPEYLATGRVTYSNDEEAAAAREAGAPAEAVQTIEEGQQPSAQPSAPGGTTIIFGSPTVGAASAGAAPAAGTSSAPVAGAQGEASAPLQGGGATVVAAGGAPAAAQPQPNYVPQMSVEEAEKLNEAQGSYVEELKKLVETLGKVNEQSQRLTRDSEEMENLNRTLTGISRVYEMQLKGASQQIGTIDQINEQTRRLAQQIEQLNQIYARMIEAMTVNMRTAAPGAAPQAGGTL